MTTIITALQYKARDSHATTREQDPCSLFVAWMTRLARAQRGRMELNDMTDVELKDIGLTRGDIGTVVNGRFSRF